MNSLDIVIPLCKNCSHWQDNELRYALRSIEMYVPNLGNVFIVGYKPNWLKNVIHIECENANKSVHLANQNILQKVLIACNDVRLSEDFIFTNDDIFILKPLEDLPNYYERTLEGYLEHRRLTPKPLNLLYKKAITRTIEFLSIGNFPTIHYDIHAPIIYNKNYFKLIFENIKEEIVIKSIYANIAKGNDVFLPDNKINTHKTLSRLNEINESQKFFSINDNALNSDMKKYLSLIFKNKSKYE